MPIGFGKESTSLHVVVDQKGLELQDRLFSILLRLFEIRHGRVDLAGAHKYQRWVSDWGYIYIYIDLDIDLGCILAWGICTTVQCI